MCSHAAHHCDICWIDVKPSARDSSDSLAIGKGGQVTVVWGEGQHKELSIRSVQDTTPSPSLPAPCRSTLEGIFTELFLTVLGPTAHLSPCVPDGSRIEGRTAEPSRRSY